MITDPPISTIAAGEGRPERRTMRATRNTTFMRWALIAALLLFGGLTLFLSTSVLLDLFEIREKEGNYVQFVVLANFFASILYFAGAVGLVTRKPWARYPLGMAIVVLLVASVAFARHVYQGGIHEQRTIGALAFRTVLSIAFYATAAWIGRSDQQPTISARP